MSDSSTDQNSASNTLRSCVRCLYHEDIPNISFDEQGICGYCRQHEALDQEYPTGSAGQAKLDALYTEIRAAGKGKKYDCVVGVSGGCDSSYLLHKCVEAGLRPLAVHFDNTWNSMTATENIHSVLSRLNVDLFTLVVDNKEYDDIYRSFFRSGTPDLEIPTDIGFAVTLYRAAEKYDIKYIIEGHSYRTEGIAPLGWIYMDGRYIKSVQKKFGSYKLKTYPNMPLISFIKWMSFKGIKKVRPLYYMDYHKEAAKDFLMKELGWKWYGGHHLENRFTAFYHSYFWPRRFGFDDRVIENSALIRSGQITRAEGLRRAAGPYPFDPELIELVKKRLEFSDDYFEQLMKMPKKNYRDYKTYKKTFEFMRPFFWIMLKMNLVTKSFYLKYTFPDPIPNWVKKYQAEEAKLIHQA